MSTASQTLPMSGLSALFSLSDAAATVPPIPVSTTESAKTTKNTKDLASGKYGSHALKHRRLSSTGQTRRRMSDAREAVSRPVPANLSAASALASLSSLSLTPSGITSTSAHNLHSHSALGRGRSHAGINQQSFAPSSVGSQGSGALASSLPETSYGQDMASSVADDIDVDIEDDDAASVAESFATRSTDKKSGKSARPKKRGTIFQCESCSKVYRHPNCLVKHRWEHTPQWREASKFMLSKHQQVQVLEAAAILYSGTSLPDDKSYWPAFVSNGLLPPPSTENTQAAGHQFSSGRSRSGNKSAALFPGIPHPVSSSLPIRAQTSHLDRGRSGSVTSTASGVIGGPRMHDFTVPGGITQIRPGLLAHPTAPTRALNGTVSPYADEELDVRPEDENSPTHTSLQVVLPLKSQPMSVPQNNVANNRNQFEAYRDGGSAFSASGFSAESGSVSASLAHSGGWSLPHSDLRSSSVARSYSGSRSDDDEDVTGSARGVSEDDIDVDVDVDVAESHRERLEVEPSYGSYSSNGFGFSNGRRKEPVIKEEDDDGWEEMDMEL